MTSPKFFSKAPTQPKVLPFASATDPTLHRSAWKSTRAIETFTLIPRRPPSRFRGQLRYDLLGPLQPSAPKTVESTGDSESPVSKFKSLANDDSPESTNNAKVSTDEPQGSSPTQQALGPRQDAATTKPATNNEAVVKSTHAGAKTLMTNLEELRWFQHRWLDKHGRNSNLKTTREQLALMRRWFDSLDADGSGEVGLDELEDPLVSVGLAASRDDVQRLIEEVDVNGTGSVTFDAFLNLFYPERVKRERTRRFPPPLHAPKHRPPARSQVSSGISKANPKGKRSRHVETNVVNPVARLFENLQAGKLGDLTVPFPVLITAYRRRMLLDAHMADNSTAKRVGSSVLQALESTKRDNSTPETTFDWRKKHTDLQLPTLP
ncbi:EF-hand domain pair [Phytophthora infestans]|uniref:EF-hand domain pair n=1 Tax=Phytophthora infestans TaxID=4787 RepID=A0A833S0I6_PHYIN|nr:EF-hand domain pair [Phytophthora infestans]